MTIQARPMPLRPPITSVRELDIYLARRLEALYPDCYDDDIRSQIGSLARNRSTGAYSALSELRGLIVAWVVDEMEDAAFTAHEESIEDRYKEAYGPEPLAPYQAEGR